MKSLAFLIILKLGIINTTSASFSTKDHVNFISAVFNVYKPSSLIFVHFADYRNWTQMNLIFNTQLLLSRKNIMTLALNFKEIFSFNSSDLCDIKGIKNDSKPMSIFFLTSEKATKEMMNLPKQYLSKLINLVLFVKIDESPLIEFCLKPFGNSFLLRSDLFFLIKCYEESIIQQCQPINSNQMRIFEWATWEPETGLVLKSENFKFKEINQLNGQVLFTGKVQDYVGLVHYMDSTLVALQMAANFTIVNREKLEAYGTWDESNKTWSGGYGLIVNGKVDLMTSLFIMSSRGISSVDYTIPIKNFEMFLCIKKPSTVLTFSWTGYFHSFSYGVWVAMLLLLIAIHTLLTVMKTRMQNWFGPRKFVLESYLHIWGCYCQQGLSEFPTASSLRLVYCTSFLFAFCILSIYSACFVSDLTIMVENIPFKTLEDFVNDGSYKLAILQNSENYDFFQEANKSPWLEMKHLLMNRNELPSTIEKAANMICHDNIALWVDDLDFFLIENSLRLCPVIKVPTGTSFSTGMILSKNSPYTKVINYHISKLRESGTLKNLDSVLGVHKYNLRSKSGHKYKSVTFWHVVPLLAITAVGIVLAAIVFCFEKIYCDWFDKIKNIHIKIISKP